MNNEQLAAAAGRILHFVQDDNRGTFRIMTEYYTVG